MDDNKTARPPALDPCVVDPSQATRRWLDENRVTHIEVSLRYHQGRVDATSYGAALGYWVEYDPKPKRRPIVLVAVRTIGITRYWIGVSPGRRNIYLGREGKLWRVPAKRLPSNAADPRKMDKAGKRVWSASVETMVLDKLCPVEEVRAVYRTGQRYRAAVRALVQRRVQEGREYGRELSADGFAQGACEAWSLHDLLSPRVPSIQHALYTSLVLSLPPETAAELIELAATVELRLPILNRHMAQLMYESAVQKLGALCPAWLNEGWALEWRYWGSIDLYLRKEFARVLGQAEGLEVDLGAAEGKMRQALPE